MCKKKKIALNSKKNKVLRLAKSNKKVKWRVNTQSKTKLILFVLKQTRETNKLHKISITKNIFSPVIDYKKFTMAIIIIHLQNFCALMYYPTDFFANALSYMQHYNGTRQASAPQTYAVRIRYTHNGRVGVFVWIYVYYSILQRDSRHHRRH